MISGFSCTAKFFLRNMWEVKIGILLLSDREFSRGSQNVACRCCDPFDSCMHHFCGFLHEKSEISPLSTTRLDTVKVANNLLSYEKSTYAWRLWGCHESDQISAWLLINHQHQSQRQLVIAICFNVTSLNPIKENWGRGKINKNFYCLKYFDYSSLSFDENLWFYFRFISSFLRVKGNLSL